MAMSAGGGRLDGVDRVFDNGSTHMTKRIVATVGGCLVAFVVYLFLWFIVRNMVTGVSAATTIAIHAAVAGISIWAGISSYRASMR